MSSASSSTGLPSSLSFSEIQVPTALPETAGIINATAPSTITIVSSTVSSQGTFLYSKEPITAQVIRQEIPESAVNTLSLLGCSGVVFILSVLGLICFLSGCFST